jgi:ribosomal protein S18 acetylase RimI-like enzyme
LGEIEVRGYSEGDRDACRRLWEELTVWHREIYGDPSIGGTEPGLYFDEHLAKTGSEHLIVAVAGTTVVGLVGYMVEDEEVEVEPLVVTRSHRGRGIGSMLLDEVVKRLERTGIRYLTVRPVVRNTKALEFFRSRGFDKVGRIELFIDYTSGSWKKDLRLFELDFRY